MNTLFALLLFIFVGIALMVLLGERFARPLEPEKARQLSRWIMPLVALSIVLAMLNHYF
jgi:uncharacterized membrane protein YfcA